jgi:hypothetical protein
VMCLLVCLCCACVDVGERLGCACLCCACDVLACAVLVWTWARDWDVLVSGGTGACVAAPPLYARKSAARRATRGESRDLGSGMSPQVRPGVLPRMLQEILDTRVMIKGAMKRVAAADKVRRAERD